MPTVDIGAETYTTYADLETADLYALGATHATAFRALNDDDRSRTLVTSTRTLDRQDWKPEYDTFEERVVVPDIVTASIEIAIALAEGSDLQNASAGGETNIHSMSAGSVSITYFRGTTLFAARFPTIINELLNDYLLGGSAGLSKLFGAKATGTDAKSIFPLDLGFTGGIGRAS